MVKLKLGPIVAEKPIKMTVGVPASLHVDLCLYAQTLGRETGQDPVDPIRLIIPMLERFVATDRGFARAKRALLITESKAKDAT